MKKIKTALICALSLICCLSFVFGLVACKETEQAEEAKLYLVTSEYALEVGESAQIKIKYDGENTVSFTSANTEIVTVDDTGKVFGIASGSTYITASVGEQAVTCKITVNDVEYSVFLGLGDVNVVVGTEINFIAELRRNNVAYEGSVAWSLSGCENVLFTSDGKKAQFKSTIVGEYYVTAKSDKAETTCKIRVVEENAKRLNAPELLLTNCDTISWTAISGAQGYEVSINGGEWIKTTETTYSITEISNAMRDGDRTIISVKTLAGSDYSLIDSFIVGKTVKHDFSIEELTEATCFITGQAKFTCANCERNYIVEEYVEEHSFNENHVCSKCKSERTPAFLYMYDEDLDCYYVGGIKSTSYPIAYVSGFYDDGTHGYKPVEYITQVAFKGNASITHLILPENVTAIYGNAFQQMTELRFLNLGGVTEFKLYYRGIPSEPDYSGMNEEEKSIAKENYEAEKKSWRTGFNQVLACNKLETLVVKAGLRLDEQAFIYSENVEHHRMTIYTMLEEGGDVVFTPTDNMWNGKLLNYDATNTKCNTWHFADNGYDVELSTYTHKYREGKCKYCGKLDPTKYVIYGYDKTNDCYYVGNSTEYLGETVIVPSTYDDGINGEKAVKYVANGAFKGNKNIKKVVLAESVNVVGANSFANCTSLEYMSMVGVKDVSAPSATWYAQRYNGYEKARQGYNAFLNAPIKTLIVGSSFDAFEKQFTNSGDIEPYIKVYSTLETPCEWVNSNQTPFALRVADNTMFDVSFEAPATSPIYFYSEEMPTNKLYKFWHYDDQTNEVVIWTEYGKAPELVDAQGITYGYDTQDDDGNDDTTGCYYVAGNKTFTGETVIIPATYNDGINGEKAVKYVANGAFSGNTNIKKVILPSSVEIIGASAFNGCTSLSHIEMPGVKQVSHTSASWYASWYAPYANASQGMNTFLSTVIEILVVGEQFDTFEQQFVNNNFAKMRVYSTLTEPEVWDSSAKKAGKITLRSDNNMLDISFTSPATSPISYYSATKPTNKSYTFWYYNNGVPTLWTEYAE